MGEVGLIFFDLDSDWSGRGVAVEFLVRLGGRRARGIGLVEGVC